MKAYTGRLNMIGSGHWIGGISRRCKVSVVEIGNHAIKNVYFDENIDSYLNVGEEITLYIGRLGFTKTIFGVRRPNGNIIKMKFYYLFWFGVLKLILLSIASKHPDGEIFLSIIAFTLLTSYFTIFQYLKLTALQYSKFIKKT